MNFTTKVVAWIAIVVALASLGFAVLSYGTPADTPRTGGTTNYDALSLSETLNVTGTSTTGGLQLDTGSTLQEHNCATLSWDPAAISSSTSASTTMTLAGVALGDIVTASFGSASSTADWFATGNVAGAGTSTIILQSVPGSATFNAGLDHVTSTARVCYFGY